MQTELGQTLRRGLFIVFEGLDRSGKSTQSSMLARYLKDELNIQVKSINFPNRESATGKMINEYLRNKEVKHSDESIHLIFSANRWEQREQIIKDLQSGITLVCDRYAYSGVAYSAAKGLDFNWCMNPDRGLVKPDLTFFIDANPELLTSRSEFGQERYERLEFQKKVSDAYSRFKDLESHDPHWVTVDAQNKSVEELHSEILERVIQYRNEELVSFEELMDSLFIKDSSSAINGGKNSTASSSTSSSVEGREATNTTDGEGSMVV